MTSPTQSLAEAVGKYIKDPAEVRHLLEEGGDPFQYDARTHTSLLLSACGGQLNLDVINLVADYCGKHPERKAILAYINSSNFYGETPLSKLCTRNTFPEGFADTVKHLLSLGADCNPLMAKGKKLPLELYKQVDQPEAAKALGWMLVRLCETAPAWDRRRSQTLHQLMKQAKHQPEAFRAFLDVGIKAYVLCFGFDHKHDDASFHHCYGRLMAHCAQKGQWEKQQAQTSWYTLDYCRDVRDMLMDVATRLLLPQLLLTTGLHQNEEFLRSLPTSHLVTKLLPVAAELIYQNKIVEGLLGVLKNWNDRNPEFPSELNPYGSTGTWHALTRDYLISEGPAQGMHIVCLTSSTAMKDESNRLLHSAENLAHEALSGQAHFFSVRDAANQPVSTFVLRRKPVGDRYEDTITVPGLMNDIAATLYMEQHRAEKNDPPSSEAVAAYQAFKHAIQTNNLGVNLQQAGDTEQSRASKAHIPPVLLLIGDQVSPGMVEDRFAHYASAKGVAFVPGEDKKEKQFRPSDTHFFSGIGIKRPHSKALRDMRAEECFEASGVDTGIQRVIADVYPALGVQLRRGQPPQELPKEVRLR